jgi:hypothetical protein
MAVGFKMTWVVYRMKPGSGNLRQNAVSGMSKRIERAVFCAAGEETA